MDKLKITIIGAGVIGLSIAYELSKKHNDIIVLEKNEKYGLETSSRNSEVLHAGIYYPFNSLKARLCVEGIEALYEFAQKYNIPHLKTGKIIAAAKGEEEKLQKVYEAGSKNGVKGLSLITKTKISELEENVEAEEAVYSENTGIINAHFLMDKLYHLSSANGVMFSYDSEVNLIEKASDGYILGIKSDDYKFKSETVINASGLNSDKIAALTGINIEENEYELNYCKGSYFSYGGPSPVKRLIYPVPHDDLKGLGVHSVVDLSGRLKFGPDAEYVDEINYNVDEAKRDEFYESASKLIKGLDKDSFFPEMSGVRPKIKGEGVKDFIIKNEKDKGLDGFINLIGIESPGLTACLAIGNYVKKIMD